VPVHGDLVAELDREQHQRHTEVIDCDVVEHADGNPGEHPRQHDDAGGVVSGGVMRKVRENPAVRRGGWRPHWAWLPAAIFSVAAGWIRWGLWVVLLVGVGLGLGIYAEWRAAKRRRSSLE
jgi:hypothetical protein